MLRLDLHSQCRSQHLFFDLRNRDGRFRQKRNQVFDSPNTVGEFSFHRGRDTQSLVDSREIDARNKNAVTIRNPYQELSEVASQDQRSRKAGPSLRSKQRGTKGTHTRRRCK